MSCIFGAGPMLDSSVAFKAFACLDISGLCNDCRDAAPGEPLLRSPHGSSLLV